MTIFCCSSRTNPIWTIVQMTWPLSLNTRLRSHRPSRPDDPEIIYFCSNRIWQQIALWLRTGHSPLQAHMHRVGRADHPFCPHCPSTPEGRRHFLLECPAYETERTQYITPIIDPHGVLGSRSDPHLVDFLLRSSNIDVIRIFIFRQDTICKTST